MERERVIVLVVVVAAAVVVVVVLARITNCGCSVQATCYRLHTCCYISRLAGEKRVQTDRVTWYLKLRYPDTITPISSR